MISILQVKVLWQRSKVTGLRSLGRKESEPFFREKSPAYGVFAIRLLCNALRGLFSLSQKSLHVLASITSLKWAPESRGSLFLGRHWYLVQVYTGQTFRGVCMKTTKRKKIKTSRVHPNMSPPNTGLCSSLWTPRGAHPHFCDLKQWPVPGPSLRSLRT